jgi:hypothetical protein
LEWASRLISVVAMLSFLAGTSTPSEEALAYAEKELQRKRAETSRQNKASRRLLPIIVEYFILRAFEDRTLVKNAKSDGQKAARVLETVNRRLAEAARHFGLAATSYKDADSLRRRYAAIKGRKAAKPSKKNSDGF